MLVFVILYNFYLKYLNIDVKFINEISKKVKIAVDFWTKV